MTAEQERLTRQDREIVEALLAGATFPSAPHVQRALNEVDALQAELQAAQERETKLTEDQYREAHAQGFDDGLEAVWSEPVCSVCGLNHDRDESAACDGCEVVSFQQWVAAQRTEEPRKQRFTKNGAECRLTHVKGYTGPICSCPPLACYAVEHTEEPDDGEKALDALQELALRWQAWPTIPGSLKWSRDGLDALAVVRSELRAARERAERFGRPWLCDCHTWPDPDEAHAYIVALEEQAEAQREALQSIENMAGAGGSGEVPAWPIAAAARKALGGQR